MCAQEARHVVHASEQHNVRLLLHPDVTTRKLAQHCGISNFGRRKRSLSQLQRINARLQPCLCIRAACARGDQHLIALLLRCICSFLALFEGSMGVRIHGQAVATRRAVWSHGVGLHLQRT